MKKTTVLKPDTHSKIPSKKRILVFGIDGATWEIIELMEKQNKLPNFRKIMREGVYGDLRSVNPPVTCPAWATMFTGKNPATLGVFHFFKPTAEYEQKLSRLTWRAWRPIWDILSEHDKIVYVFNVPTTTANKINGKFISGPIWGEQEGDLAYPEELNNRLKKERYQIRTDISHKVSGDEVYIKDITRITENKFKIMYEFFKDENWDLLIMSFYYCDQIQHRYWKYLLEDHPKYTPNNKCKTAIFDHYELLDKYLGKVLNNLAENTTVLVASDHGHEPTHTFVNFNAWLHDKGFLKFKDNYRNREIGGTKRNTNTGFLRLYYYLTQSYSKFVYLSKLRHNNFLNQLRNKFKDWSYVFENKFSVKYPIKNYVNWKKTQAYSLIFNTISLNLINREVFGVISEKDYLDVRNKIIKELKELEDPKLNKKVIKHVWTKEQLFPKNTPFDFPEIYIQFNRGYRNYYSELHTPTEIFSHSFKGSTEHYLDGIFLAYGPEIMAGKKVDDVKLEDIAPTILHIFKYPIPDEIDGKVLVDVFKKGTEPASRTIIRAPKTTKDSEKSKIRGIKFSKTV